MAKTALMSGNEAIARGAYEAGARLVVGYPGTPSTEIVEAARAYEEMYSEWSVNEKVAMEVAIGAALAGSWAMVTMKHVGLNVAADPLMTVSYMHITGALVIVSADDPGMWSSQNEQDNRTYARFARIPMFEPSDSQEAKDMVCEAFRLSNRFNVPVLVRVTTKLSHTRCPVKPGVRQHVHQGPEKGKKVSLDPALCVMIPANARKRHPVVEQRLVTLAEYAEKSEWNRIEEGRVDAPAFISSGIPYQYVKEAFPESSVLKLGLSYPLPLGVIREFAKKAKKLYVVEELDPLVETELRAAGVSVEGKDLLPRVGEHSVSLLKHAISGAKGEPPVPAKGVPPRPPLLCAGCPHRGVFHALRGKKSLVFGDIGCYSLGVMKPLEALHSCTCMGAGIGHAHGLEKALGSELASNSVAVIGDSTFFHSGITALLNSVYNGGKSKVIILDNKTTAMTGHQANPGTGQDLKGNAAPSANLEQLVRSLGVKHVFTVDPYDLKRTKEAIDKALELDECAVIISERECALLKSAERRPAAVGVPELCRECGLCHKLGCPALFKIDGKAAVDNTLCNGCEMCVQVCPFGALKGGLSSD